MVMSRRSGPRRWPVFCALVAVWALGAAPTTVAVASAHHPTATRAAKQARVRVSHVDIDPDPVPVGGSGTVRFLLANQGPDPTASPFTVTVVLPTEVTAVGPFFPSSCLADALGHTVTCTFPGGLSSLRTASVLIPVQISAAACAHCKLSDGTVTVSSIDDPDGKVHTVQFSVRTA
jgi:hypothetical protein